MMKKQRDGFTLIEMLVVLLILGIVLLLVVPNVRALQTERTLSTARTVLVSDLRLLQETVRSHGERGEWRPARGAYELVVVDSDGGSDILLSRTLPTEVRITHNGRLPAPVIFQPNGSCARYCTIRLYDEKRRSYDIVLYKTGRIREVAT